jgi:hypothetical protein
LYASGCETLGAGRSGDNEEAEGALAGRPRAEHTSTPQTPTATQLYPAAYFDQVLSSSYIPISLVDGDSDDEEQGDFRRMQFQQRHRQWRTATALCSPQSSDDETDGCACCVCEDEDIIML